MEIHKLGTTEWELCVVVSLPGPRATCGHGMLPVEFQIRFKFPCGYYRGFQAKPLSLMFNVVKVRVGFSRGG